MPKESEQRRICQQLYPFQYRNAAHMILFADIPYHISGKIHQYRNIEDLLVPYETVKLIIGYGKSVEKDEVIDNVFDYKFPFLVMMNNALLSDKGIVLVAVSLNGFELSKVGDDMKDDKEIVLAAVGSDGESLEYASTRLRADREVVLTAVNTYGMALRFACNEIKNDREIVLAAVEQDGRCLGFVSDELEAEISYLRSFT